MKNFQLVFLGFSLLVTIYFSTIINKNYRIIRRDLTNRDSLVDQNVLMAVLNKDGVIISISNALCRCLGGVKHDFIGTNSNFFVAEDENPELITKISHSLLTGQSWQGEFKRHSVDGEEIWLASSIFPVRNQFEDEDMDSFHNILEDITHRKILEKTSITDTLTSLYNRRKFDEVIDHEIMLARRRKTCLTLAVVDVDYFKNYNDLYGHPKGDKALIRTAATIRSILSRPDDYVFRLGGEEFAIIFNDLNIEGAQKILEQIRMGVEQLKIKHDQNSVSDYLTISIGAKVYGTDTIIDKDVFYGEADELLYTAKKTRNTVVVG